MKRTLTHLGDRLTDPRKMMLIAGLLAAMGLLAGYVEVQQQAERALALRAGPPATVAVQDFTAARDIGAAGEVSLLAEVDFDRAVVLSLRGAKPARHAVVAPMFDISTAGSVRLADEAPQMSAASDNYGRAAGYVIRYVAEPPTGRIDAAALGLVSMGPGALGSVVHLSGEAVEAGAFQLMADGAFAAQGLTLGPDFVAVTPYLEGREAALLAREETLSHRALYLCALVVMLVATAGSLRAFRGREAVDIAYLPDIGGAGDVVATRRHPAFDPLPAQTDLQGAQRSAPKGPLRERLRSLR